MCVPVEVDVAGIELMVCNGLLERGQAGDRQAVGEACLAALEQWAQGHGARTTNHKPRGRVKALWQGIVKTDRRPTP